MRVFVLFITVVVNLILQSTVFQYIEIFGVKPNTTILLVVSYAVLRGDIEAGLFGFFAGLLQDMFFGYYLGLYAFLYALIGFLCGKPFKIFFRENFIIPIFLSFISIMSFSIIFYTINFLIYGKTHFSYYFGKIILPEAIYTTVLAFFIYKFVYYINNKLELREKKKSIMFK